MTAARAQYLPKGLNDAHPSFELARTRLPTRTASLTRVRSAKTTKTRQDLSTRESRTHLLLGIPQSAQSHSHLDTSLKSALLSLRSFTLSYTQPSLPQTFSICDSYDAFLSQLFLTTSNISNLTHSDLRSRALTTMDTNDKENDFLGMGSPFWLKLGMEQDQLHFDYNYSYSDRDSPLERREVSLSPFDYSRDQYRFPGDSAIHNPDFKTSPLGALMKRPREDNDEGEPDTGTLKSPFKLPSRRQRGPLFSPPSRVRTSPFTPFDSINSPRRPPKTSPYGWRAASEASSFVVSRSPFDIGGALDFPLDPENVRWGSESPVLRTGGSASSGGSSEGTTASQQEQPALVRDGEVDASGSDDSEYLASTRVFVTPVTPPVGLNQEGDVFSVGSPLTPVPERRQIARKRRRVTWAGEPELEIPISARVRLRANTVGDISSAVAVASSSSSSSPFEGQYDDDEEPGQAMGSRALPPGTEMKDGFWRWYREFPVIKNGGRTGGGAVRNVPSVAVGVSKSVVKSPSTRVEAMSAEDLYTPRWVKGRGVGKLGMCPVCGEEGKTRWFAMKFSAYNYHMQYSHGISAATFRPLDPPLKVRVGKPESSKVTASASKAGRSSSPLSSPQPRWNIGQQLRPESEKLYGLCGRCEDWVPVEGVKDVVMKVPEMVWWKHIRGCQGKEKGKGKRK